MVDRRLLSESMDEHSLLTVYEWIAERVEGLQVLVVGTGDGEGPARLARRADLVFVYEQAKDIVGDASYRYGHVSNLYFSTGGHSDAIREVVNFDIVIALESAVPRSFIRGLAEHAGVGGRRQVVVTRKTTDVAQPESFTHQSAIPIWGRRITAVGSSPADDVESLDWGEPIAGIVVASNHPLDQRWETTYQAGTSDVGPREVRESDEWRATQELKTARADLDAVLNDRAIRPVLKAVKALRKIRRRTRGQVDGSPPPSRLEMVNRSVVEDRIRALRPDPGPVDGPLVSIIILTRDGADVLSRLLEALVENTMYRSFEVVVVDNGSSDETGSLLDNADFGYSIRGIRNDANQPFSEGCNAGAGMAMGELLLFLNNDVEPINEGWLGAMVGSISGSEGPRAVGALLVHPEIHPKLGVPFPVQHRGVEFRWREGRPVGVHIGVGDEATDPAFRFDEKVPALTGACLLVRREDFEKVGGFTTGFVYGLEDVDLCLKLREAGVEMRLCGAAALFHKESTTQRRAAANIRNTKRLTNAHLFDERWKEFLSTRLLVDQLTGAGDWTIVRERTANVVVSKDQAVAGTSPAALAAGLRELGWLVETTTAGELRPDMDLTVVTTAEFDADSLLGLGGPALAWPVGADPKIDSDWTARFHAIAAPGPRMGRVLEKVIGQPVPVLGPCVDTEIFQPLEPELALRCDFAVVAPASPRSSIVTELTVRPEERFLIFGPGWEAVPDARLHHRGEVEQTDLPLLYCSMDILIHSTVLDPDPSSSQIFAAIACGALVVTDDEESSESVFGGALPVFRDVTELRFLLDQFLTDPDARGHLVSHLRGHVLTHHRPEVIAEEAISLVKATIEGSFPPEHL